MDKQMPPPPVTHHGHPGKLFRPARLIEIHCTRSRSAPNIHKCWNDLRGIPFEQGRISVLSGLHLMDKTNVPSTPVIGVPPCKHIHVWIDGDIVNISESMGKSLQFRAVRPYPDDSPTIHG